MAMKTKRKKTPVPCCRDCGSTEDVESGLCATCETENYVWCEVCQGFQNRDGELCRHVFWTDCGYNGAGGYEDDWNHCRESFFRLLDLLAAVPKYSRDGDGWCWSEKETASDLITALERRLARDNFWTFTHGFLLSTPDVDFVEGRTDLHPSTKCLLFANIRGTHFVRWREKSYELYQSAGDGFAWLESLCAEETKQANARTLKWIMDWRFGRVRR